MSVKPDWDGANMNEEKLIVLTLDTKLADTLFEAADYMYTHYTDIDRVALMRTANELNNALEKLKLATANDGITKINVTEDEYSTLKTVALYAENFFTLTDSETAKLREICEQLPRLP